MAYAYLLCKRGKRGEEKSVNEGRLEPSSSHLNKMASKTDGLALFQTTFVTAHPR